MRVVLDTNIMVSALDGRYLPLVVGCDTEDGDN